MSLKIYNKITLREHPDGSPQDDAAFEKAHSFIFPGDEIVFCTKIDGNNDLGSPLAGITLKSVKMSLIAKKPNIFSEEFSREFEATRSFVLDTQTISINSSNAPVVPWGSDGYAPNINFTQDRNWKLPSGDFKRQIKAFTEHTSSTSSWWFNFYFPVIFRWEYWKALAAADNDFYNTVLSQNGKYQKWLRYHDISFSPFGWLIKFKFEIFYTYNKTGIQESSVSELNLSNELLSINDYNRNYDYDFKEIKTCPVGGTPINTPAIILGDQNTSCFAYFTKLAAWDSGEKEKINAVFWIEPFEGGGITDRTRASSIFSITPESVFNGVDYIATNDDGDIITRDNTDIAAMDYSGAGVYVTFDPGDDKNIICQAEIDYIKLLATYPGVKNFTLYCRLYNGTTLLAGSTTISLTPSITGSQFIASSSANTYTIDLIPSGYDLDEIIYPNDWTFTSASPIVSGSQTIDLISGISSGTIKLTYKNGDYYLYTYIDVYVNNSRMGEEIKQDCIFIPSLNPVNPDMFCEDDSNECIFNLDVFADPTDATNFLRNDKSDFYFYGNQSIASIEIILQKYSNGSFEDLISLVDNTYGQFFDFGQSPDFSSTSFTDDFGKQYTGIFLEWLKIYNDYDEGRYRIKTIKTDIFSTTFTEYDKKEFCLHKWTCYNTDGTVKIELFNSGLRGKIDDGEVQIDYYTGWRGEIRLKGIFYEGKPNYNKEFNQYGDASFNAKKPYINELIPKFLLDIKPHPGWMDWLLSNYVLLSDEILITDFNLANRKTFVRIPVNNENGIDVKDEDFTNPLAWSQISFEYGRNNLRKRNS